MIGHVRWPHTSQSTMNTCYRMTHKIFHVAAVHLKSFKHSHSGFIISKTLGFALRFKYDKTLLLTF